MSKQEKYQLLIAESSPVISSGFAQTIRRIPVPHLQVSEINNPAELSRRLNISSCDILLINPTFGGLFDPVKFRKEIDRDDLKIIAIEIGRFTPQTSALYDGVIHVTDDLETIKNKLKDICLDKPVANEEKENLSTREKEIISLVVKGLTNQEIADKLFLSIHTVITHRRNIARKLEIHSATGLTIYAIVNKIIDIEDVVY